MLTRLDRLIRYPRPQNGDMWRPCGGDDPGLSSSPAAHHIPWIHFLYAKVIRGMDSVLRIFGTYIVKLLWSGNAIDGATSLKS